MSENQNTSSIALDIAKNNVREMKTEFTTSKGVNVILKPVSEATVLEAQRRVKDPVVPIIYDEERDREIENPMHPAYLSALEDASQKRLLAIYDVILVMGVELADSLPKDSSWINELKLLERQGHIDLSIYDLDDQFDLEFLYKKNIAFSAQDLLAIMDKVVVTEEGVAAAVESFPGNEE